MMTGCRQFLGINETCCALADAATAVLKVPYEGGVSFGQGAAGAPDAVIAASQYLELYDEELCCEPYRTGICTVDAPELGDTPESMVEAVYAATAELLELGKFVVTLGGDHSISSPCFAAHHEHFPQTGLIQFDAHTDLRDSFEGSRLSHACVMARMRERTEHTLQLGIRSMSAEEAERIRRDRMVVATMQSMRNGTFDLESALSELPESVYVTLDVDVLDWNVVRSTGTPEPGGMSWDEVLCLLRAIVEEKTLVGCDIVELAHNPADVNSAFAVAKLIYKVIGYRTVAATRE